MADNRIAYGIAQGMGINTDGMKPKAVWQAIADKQGVSVEQVMRHAYAQKVRESLNKRIAKASEELKERPLSISAEAKRRLVEYVKMFRNGKSVEKEIDLMKVSTRTKKALEELLNQEIDAQTHSLHIDELRHMEKRHGEKGTANHDLAETGDYEEIIDALNDYDGKPEFSRDNQGQIRYSKKYKNKDGTPTPQIIMRKKIGEEVREVVVTVSNSKNKGVKTITSYKNKE